MDRRLMEAYDHMTMPEDWARNIEKRLRESPKPRKQGRYTMVLRQKENRWAWVQAAVLVCLVMMVAVGGVAMFVGGDFSAKPADIPGFTQSTEETAAPTLPAETEDPETEAFLEKMCHVMPQWDGYASLDDAFWTEFIVRLLNDYTVLDGQGARVSTLAGEGVLADGKIQIQRDRLEAFVQETMGCPLPDFLPSGPYLDLISWEWDTVSAAVTEFPRLRYEMRSRETGKNPSVTYDIYQDPEEERVGEVTFYLWEEENDRGFIIVGRPTTMRVTRIEDPEIEAVARAFGEAYFANDIEGVKAHLSHRDDSTMILSVNPLVQQEYNRGEPLDYDITDVRIFTSIAGKDYPVAYADYKSPVNPWYSDRSLVLEMVETEEGWKVRSFDDKYQESYDPDREEIYINATATAWNYLTGHYGDLFLASPWMTPPVYDGDPQDAQISNVTIFYDPLGEPNEQGEKMADVQVEIMESPDALNPIYLFLHFVKKDVGWRIDVISEG